MKFADGSQGFVDCFWPSTILVEMKSEGKDLDAAFGQAMDYVRALPDQSTLPRAIVVSDFQAFRFCDLTKDAQLTTFKLADRFGQYFARIPIKASPHIVCANALTTDSEHPTPSVPVVGWNML